MTHHCFQCGYAIIYASSKPVSCPKCSSTIAKAFVPKPIPTAPIVAALEDDDPPVPPRRAAARRTTPPPIGDSIEGIDAGIDEDQPPLDRRAARQLARELIARIDPSSIRVGGDGEDVMVRFGDLIAQGERAQNGGQG